MHEIVKTVLLTGGVITGSVCQLISLPLWGVGDVPYFALWSSSLIALVIFGVALIGMFCFCDHVPTFNLSKTWKMFCLIGALNTLNGILIVYSAPENRTPPILQAIFSSNAIIFSIPATKYLVKSKSHLYYCRPEPIVALFAMAMGILFSLVPTIMRIAEGDESLKSSGIIWSCVFLIGIIPGVISNVLQERLFNLRKEEVYRDTVKDIFTLLTFTSLFQMVFIALLFEIDFIPWFGYSANMTDFSASQLQELKCFFGYNCSRTEPFLWLYGLIFCFGYCLLYGCQAGLNTDSASYGMIVILIASPVAIAFWLIFPNLNQQVNKTPIWSIVPSLLCILCGAAVWKYWEKEQHKKLYSYDLVN